MTARARLPRVALLPALLLLVAVATLGVAWAARVSEGTRALAESDSALERGDAAEAILAARVAAEARCPGCAAPEKGLTRLAKIASDAEARGDDPTAFAAWRAARSALLGARVLGASSAERAHADNEVARLAHRLDAAAVAAGAAPTAAAAEDKLRAALGASELPGAATFAIIGLGGVVFLVAAVRFARSAGDRRGSDLALAVAGAGLAAAGAFFF